jgi:hypothetical protein
MQKANGKKGERKKGCLSKPPNGAVCEPISERKKSEPKKPCLSTRPNETSPNEGTNVRILKFDFIF